MKVVGVRAMKDGLSSYLREVRRGQIVRITDRGVVVAELRPPSPAEATETEYERLVREGKIVPPSRAFSEALFTAPRRRPLSAGTALELIAADRADRT